MKQFNLDEYLANPSRRVVTRDRRNVKIHCTNYIGTQPIIAAVEDSEYSTAFCKDGRFIIGEESPRDLFFAPEKKEGWINIFKTSNDIAVLGQSSIFESKEDAEKDVKDCKYYVATIKIEWEE